MANVGSLTTTDEVISDATLKLKKEQKRFYLKHISDRSCFVSFMNTQI